MLKQLRDLKNKVKEARDINESSLERLDEERKERRLLDARLETIAVELDIMTRGANPRQRRGAT